MSDYCSMQHLALANAKVENLTQMRATHSNQYRLSSSEIRVRQSQMRATHSNQYRLPSSEIRVRQSLNKINVPENESETVDAAAVNKTWCQGYQPARGASSQGGH